MPDFCSDRIVATIDNNFANPCVALIPAEKSNVSTRREIVKQPISEYAAVQRQLVSAICLSVPDEHKGETASTEFDISNPLQGDQDRLKVSHRIIFQPLKES
ncbi:hypothetical protein J6590_025719 [Homalodisca vitripennis]|nr:hypothetical protein J6590_025719 [Homalodisca vitripennis]